MTYEETVDYLFRAAPLFQNLGAGAYKEGLGTTHLLDNHFGQPNRNYRTIHVAGTNGKGSTSHTLAAVLQCAGYKVGLYTSPHLVDFRERIKVNGKMIPKDRVVRFVEEERSFFEPLHPSFFELATALAFLYFAEEKVDVAIIEVGLGGRLDCTNIIAPELSIITNISKDHTQFLGDTLSQIAYEKAGIIKHGVPVVVGEVLPETRSVFQKQADEMGTSIVYAEDKPDILAAKHNAEGFWQLTSQTYGDLQFELSGDCQLKNAETILHALQMITLPFGADDVRQGFARVCELTGLMGRWQTVEHNPLLICDTGHNAGGWQYLSHQLHRAVENYPKVHIVFGMAADKDVSTVLSLLPTEAVYYFTQASVQRAMDSVQLRKLALNFGLIGEAYGSVAEAVGKARSEAESTDFVFVGGSSFVVADFLKEKDSSGV